MATFSLGTSIKINAAIADSGTIGVSGNETAYTAPANSYGIVEIFLGASGTVRVGGGSVYQLGASFNVQTIYVGPGQSLVLTAAPGTLYGVAGVEFKNSP